jgi:hypothetical protein
MRGEVVNVARSCTICSHPRVSEIDAALMGNVAYRRVAKQFEASAPSVYRHNREHLPVASDVTGNERTKWNSEEQEQSAVFPVAISGRITTGDILGYLVRLQKRTLRILESASTAGRHETALKAIRESRGNIELIAELERLRSESGGILDLPHIKPEQIAVILRATLDQLPEREREELLLETTDLA